MPPLPPKDIGKEENRPDIPPLPSTYNDEKENDTYLTPLPPLYCTEEGKSSDGMSIIYHGSTLALGSQVIKFFEGLRWFSGKFVNYFIDGENIQIYTMRFTYGKEEAWSDYDVTVNNKADSITIGDVGFKFIRKFCGGGHFSGIVIEILLSGKRSCRFCDRYECRYTLKNFNAF